MKKQLLYFILLAFGFGQLSLAQTTLNPGEVMIVGYYGDGTAGGAGCNEAFAFVSYVDLLPGTQIRFSEEDFDQWSGTSTEGFLIWENTSGTTIPSLTGIDIITQSQSTSSTCTASSATIGTVTFVSPGNWILGTSNEELIIYQSSSSTSIGTPICYFATDDASDVAHIPTGLSSDYIIDIESVDSDADVAIYSGPTTFSSFTDFVTQITDTANNWITQDGSGDNGQDGSAPDYPDDLPSGFFQTLSLDDVSFNQDFNIIPNPSNGTFTIMNTGKALTNVSVFDLNGRAVAKYDYNGITSNIDIDISSVLATGIYMVQISSQELTTTKKLIIE